MSKILHVRVEDAVYNKMDKQAERWKTTKQEILYAMVRENIDRWDKSLSFITVGKFKPRAKINGG